MSSPAYVTTLSPFVTNAQRHCVPVPGAHVEGLSTKKSTKESHLYLREDNQVHTHLCAVQV
ncbi:hypothetical protein SERLADRAFT_394116, partial [Serpula lacrymans var. lacrymans S7.9]